MYQKFAKGEREGLASFCPPLPPVGTWSKAMVSSLGVEVPHPKSYIKMLNLHANFTVLLY